MTKVKSTKEVINEVKSGITKDVCDKIIATCEYIMAPLAALIVGVAAIWGFSIDAAVWTTAIFGLVASVFRLVKLFLKD